MTTAVTSLGQFAMAVVIVTSLLSGCVAADSRAGDRGTAPTSEAIRLQPRTLTMAFHYEPSVLAPKSVESTGGFSDPIRLFNASLALIDSAGLPHPYLAESLPTLGSASWQVFPDGRMETRYPLRAGLRWHDGQALSAEDFVFAWRVYATPGQGLFFTTLLDQIETVVAPDPQTLVIRWRTLYPDAAAIKASDLDPLPQHLLGTAFVGFSQDPVGSREVLGNLAYWNTQYIGLGPYRLERWEPGSFIEGSAFADHALGRPSIDRVILRIIGDENTVLTNLMAGDVQIAVRSIQFEHGLLLRQRWSERDGTVLFIPSGSNPTAVQFRPEFQQVPALLDLRVRKALAHAIDRDALNAGVFDGLGLMTETPVSPQAPYAAEVDRAITKHPYDLGRSAQLMAEFGLAKGPDGFYGGAASGAAASGAPGAAAQRITIPYLVQGGTEYVQQGTILTDMWRRAGFDVQMTVLPTSARTDAATRHTFSGLHHNAMGVGEKAALNFSSYQIGTAANRWGGVNRGGWSSPDYDRLYDAYVSTLDRAERDEQMIAMAVLLSQVLPAFQTYFRFAMVAHTGALRGPQVVVPESTNTWNIHAWELS
jgi:peptide/nickel transport system substrate-binding protein